MHHNFEATRHVIALIPGQADPRVRLPGNIYIEPDIPDPDEKHIALGRFMDTWSKLELMMRQKLGEMLLTAEPATASAVAGSLSGKTLVDMMLTLSSLHLKSKDQKTYITLMERFLKLNTKRNYLVHGAWVIELVVGQKDNAPVVEAYEAREYPPLDREKREALNKLRNQAERSRYVIRVSDIGRIERDTGTIYRDLTEFHRAKLTLLSDAVIVPKPRAATVPPNNGR